jgi:hypothetical protein
VQSQAGGEEELATREEAAHLVDLGRVHPPDDGSVRVAREHLRCGRPDGGEIEHFGHGRQHSVIMDAASSNWRGKRDTASLVRRSPEDFAV